MNRSNLGVNSSKTASSLLLAENLMQNTSVSHLRKGLFICLPKSGSHSKVAISGDLAKILSCKIVEPFFHKNVAISGDFENFFVAKNLFWQLFVMKNVDISKVATSAWYQHQNDSLPKHPMKS